ncbi:MAG: FecR family protein [Bacteroidales bacterium]
MEKDFLTPEDHQLIARYLAGEMNFAEASSFRDFMGRNPDKKQAFEEIAGHWHAIELSPMLPDTDHAWEKLSTRLETAPQPQHAATRTLPQYLKWAAGWLLLVALATWIYMNWLDRQTHGELYSIQTYDDNVTLVHTLEDGTVIYLGNSTLVSYPPVFEPGSRQVNLEGEAFFDVAHNPQQPFVIQTQQARIEVLGTSFNLKTTAQGALELFVETGRVKVSAREGMRKSMIAEAGELLILHENSFSKSPFQGQYNTTWRRNHMHFKDEKLAVILHVLNLNHNTSFILDNPDLEQRRLTVTFFNHSPDTMAQLIALSLDIRYEKLSDTSYIFSSH